MKLLSVTRSQDRPLEAGPALNRATATSSAILSGAAGGNWGKKVPVAIGLTRFDMRGLLTMSRYYPH